MITRHAQYASRDTGFSLVEILVAITLMAIMTVAVAPQLRYLINFQSGADTQNRLSELQIGFAATYQANVNMIESDANAEINVGASGILHPATVAPGSRCTSTAANFTPWSNFTGHAAASLVNDGYGAPLCVFINPQAMIAMNGINLYYHTVAFVSTGPNNVLDAGTGLDSQGNLTLGGDDTGALFNGSAFAVNQYTLTAGKMRTIVQALEAYYLMRYQSDPSRSSSIDYWSNGIADPVTAYQSRWDYTNPGNQIAWTNIASPMYTTGALPDLSVVLSLSKDDVTDGYGNVINFENASANVRSPDNIVTNMNTPPYTASISTVLPGGVLYSQTAVGVNN